MNHIGMKTGLLFLFILMDIVSLRAQDSTVVTIKSGSSVKDVLKSNDIFYYPHFIPGIAYFRNGTKAAAMMNYDKLADQMLFISPNKDTLALTDEKTIKFIALAQDTFYFNEGYIKLLASNSVVKLAQKQVWELADIRKIGSHDRPATSYSVTSYRTLTDGFGRTLDLALNEDILLRKNTSYFFGNNYNQFVLAGKKNLLLFFPKKEKVLSDYIKLNDINFTKKVDLEKIVQFLAEVN